MVADIAVSKGFSLDQGGPITDLVRSESHERGDKKKKDHLRLRSSTQVLTKMIMPSVLTLQLQIGSFRQSSVLGTTLKDSPR